MTISKQSKISSGKINHQDTSRNEKPKKHLNKRGGGKKGGKTKFSKHFSKRKAIFFLISLIQKEEKKRRKGKKRVKKIVFPPTKELARRRSKELRASLSVLQEAITKFMRKAIKKRKKLTKKVDSKIIADAKAKKVIKKEKSVDSNITDFIVEAIKKDQMTTKKPDTDKMEGILEVEPSPEDSAMKGKKPDISKRPRKSIGKVDIKKTEISEMEDIQLVEDLTKREKIKEKQPDLIKFVEKPIEEERKVAMGADVRTMKEAQPIEIFPEPTEIKVLVEPDLTESSGEEVEQVAEPPEGEKEYVIKPLEEKEYVIKPVERREYVAEPIEDKEKECAIEPTEIKEELVEPDLTESSEEEVEHVAGRKEEKEYVTKPLEEYVIEPVERREYVVEPIEEKEYAIEPTEIKEELVEPDLTETSEEEEEVEQVAESKREKEYVIEPLEKREYIAEPIEEKEKEYAIEPVEKTEYVEEPIEEKDFGIQPVEKREYVEEPIEEKEYAEELIEVKEYVEEPSKGKEYISEPIEQKVKVTEEAITDEVEPLETVKSLPQHAKIKVKRTDITAFTSKGIEKKDKSFQKLTGTRKKSVETEMKTRKSPKRKQKKKEEKTTSGVLSRKDAAKVEKMKREALKEMEILKKGLILEMERWSKVVAMQTEKLKTDVKEEKEKYRATMENLNKLNSDVVKDIESLKNDLNYIMEQLKRDAEMDVKKYTKQINDLVAHVQNETSLAVEGFKKQSEEVEETKTQLYENLINTAYDMVGIRRAKPSDETQEAETEHAVGTDEKITGGGGESIWELDEFWKLILPDRTPIPETPEVEEDKTPDESLKLTEYVIEKDVIVADIEYLEEPKKEQESVASKEEEIIIPVPEKQDLKDVGKKVLRQRPPKPKPRVARCIVCKKNGTNIVRVCQCPGKLSLAHMECLMEFCHRRKYISCTTCLLPYPLVEGPTLHRIYEELRIKRETPEAVSILCPIWAVITFVLTVCNSISRSYTDKNFTEMNSLQKLVALASVIAMIVMPLIILRYPPMLFSGQRKHPRKDKPARSETKVKSEAELR